VDEFLSGTNDPHTAACKTLLQEMFVSKQLAAVWKKCIEHASLAQGILT